MLQENLLRLFVNNDMWVIWLFYGIPNFIAYSVLKKNDMWNAVDADSFHLPGMKRHANVTETMNATYHSAISVSRGVYSDIMFLAALI